MKSPCNCNLHFKKMYIFLIIYFSLTSYTNAMSEVNVLYDQNNYTLHMDDTQVITFTLSELNKTIHEGAILEVYSMNPKIVEITNNNLAVTNISPEGKFKNNFTTKGIFLGKTTIIMNMTILHKVSDDKRGEIIGEPLSITVTRKNRIIDRAFTISVATLVSIIYINFGCALNWSYLKTTVKRPIGPAIGFCCQFIIMPLLSFTVSKLIFPNNPEMQLGMLFTGVSPGGGASNIWTFLLGGNINLSIAMTTISTFAAFGMIPLWIFTLGRITFESANLGVPYTNIASLAVALVIPLFIGYLIQRYCTRFSNILVKILKPFSALLIIFIIIFAIIANMYLFQLFSWRIIIAGLCLPWLGYSFGMIAALIIKQPFEDCIAIAIETGIQNTGIAIFLLRFSLPQPEADLTTVVPVAVAIMTPIPLLIFFVYKKIRERFENELNYTVILTYDTP